MKNLCNCKHVEYCKLKVEDCTLEEAYKNFNKDKIFNKTTKEIAEMQGRKGNNLKK